MAQKYFLTLLKNRYVLPLITFTSFIHKENIIKADFDGDDFHFDTFYSPKKKEYYSESSIPELMCRDCFFNYYSYRCDIHGSYIILPNGYKCLECNQYTNYGCWRD